MRLRVEGFTPETTRYRYLWGWYARGFMPWRHCQPCLQGTRAEGIFPGMADGVLTLEPRKPFDFLYLHGNARGGPESRRDNNLHLAVRPRPGATAAVTSKYGPVFTFEDAEAIKVQPPLEALQHLTMYYRCPNFLIGMQTYDVPLEHAGPDGPRVAVKRLRETA